MEIKSERLIGQGNTAEIYRLDNNRILKLFRSGLNKGAIESEYQNGIYIQKILNCVPKAYEMVEVNGRYGIIYQEIEGKDMLKIISTSFLWRINQYVRDLAHYHLHIQKPVTDNNLCTVKEKLEYDINSVTILSEEQRELIIKYLHQLPDGNDLCHFDFHPGNIMIADNKAYILDWMTACKGDVCADVARTSLLLKYGGATHTPWIVRKLTSIIQNHIYKIYIKEYLMISKIDIEDIHRWELPVAAARLGEWIPENEKKILLHLVNEHCDRITKKAASLA